MPGDRGVAQAVCERLSLNVSSLKLTGMVALVVNAKSALAECERAMMSVQDAPPVGVADAAKAAADRAAKSIDDVLAFVEASNKRIAAMEAKADKLKKAA